MTTIKLYMHGISKNEDGSEAEYVEVDESCQFSLYSLGWKADESTLLPQDE